MGNLIYWNNKELLKISNVSLELLYEELNNIIVSQKIKQNLIDKFIEKLNQYEVGFGCVYINMSNYFQPNSNELKIFLTLLKKAVNNLEEKNLIEKQNAEEILKIKEKIQQILK